MRLATKDLKVAMGIGQVSSSGFTVKQLEQINSGAIKIEGYTWHHHQDSGRMQLVPELVHKKTGHIGGEAMGCESGQVDEFNDELLGFVLTCLFCGAITKEEFGLWCVDAVVLSDVPDFLYDLMNFKGEIFELYKVIGYVPVWRHLDCDEYALYGIAVVRGFEPYDMPLSPEAARSFLKESPGLEGLYKRVFPFVGGF